MHGLLSQEQIVCLKEVELQWGGQQFGKGSSEQEGSQMMKTTRVFPLFLNSQEKRSWRTGEVPEDWRKVHVTPVFKKGKKENLRNYKSVSLIANPEKVMEQLILDVISKHVEEKEVIRNGQHGFIKGTTCLTSLL
ncbi:rna-directed dna polymerase from mobile element jockey- hypothetical protein [Limosa lapponica baueri]|uniref:Reverse transcriptase domain-containing protein n=1 Tax=Limosa lapponica baueri TaxID=1758121 RepID=A0A2I0U1X4_LIMLA|nr:rna-directed dna polymerase from mobile element jockey- hypothetical protein [Limosa lapponica baueri]